MDAQYQPEIYFITLLVGYNNSRDITGKHGCISDLTIEYAGSGYRYFYFQLFHTSVCPLNKHNCVFSAFDFHSVFSKVSRSSRSSRNKISLKWNILIFQLKYHKFLLWKKLNASGIVTFFLHERCFLYFLDFYYDRLLFNKFWTNYWVLKT